MIVLGITGPIGSGKSYIADRICKHGFSRIDTDKIYHILVDNPSPTVNEIVNEFGKNILSENGGIDRKKLSEIVFSDKKKLLKLNEITHKYVIEKTDALLFEYEKAGEKMTVVEVPLMFESGFDKRCDYVLSVVADEQTRINRICKRNGISESEAKKRIKNQKNNEFYIEKSFFVIYNNNNEGIDEQIDKFLERILKEN